MKSAQVRHALRCWQDERDSAAVYQALAGLERDPRLARLFGKLAAAELEHSTLWEARLRKLGHAPPDYAMSLRVRILVRLARHLGVGFVLPSIAARELADRDRYSDEPFEGSARLSREERGHAAVLRVMGAGGKSFGSNLRASVLGATDGLSSNFCLLMGMSGGGAAPATILLTGIAGLVAGAGSMALGEWLSVTNARELARSQVDRELEQIQDAPGWAHKELAMIYEAKGMSEAEASQAADRALAQGPASVHSFLRSELLVDAGHLGASPASAALFSFLLFAIGAAFPVLPYLGRLPAPGALQASIALSLGALFALGLATSFFNGRSALFSGLRQVGIGAAAAALTYAAGRTVGAALG